MDWGTLNCTRATTGGKPTHLLFIFPPCPLFAALAGGGYVGPHVPTRFARTERERGRWPVVSARGL